MAKARKAASKTAASPAPKKSSTAQKPLATGDVDQFPQHTFRADMGEGLPPQKDSLNPNRAK
jgi:hypothetical protein